MITSQFWNLPSCYYLLLTGHVFALPYYKIRNYCFMIMPRCNDADRITIGNSCAYILNSTRICWGPKLNFILSWMLKTKTSLKKSQVHGQMKERWGSLLTHEKAPYMAWRAWKVKLRGQQPRLLSWPRAESWHIQGPQRKRTRDVDTKSSSSQHPGCFWNSARTGKW